MITWLMRKWLWSDVIMDRYLEPVQEEVDKKAVLTIPKINCKEVEGIGRDKNQYSITIVDKNQLINN